MAIFEVKVPQLSESVAEATLLQWKKKVGDAVGQDEILIEIETDKVVLEVPSPSAGVLTEIVVGDGGTVVAEQLIAKIDSTAVATSAPAAAAAPAPAAAAPAKPAPAPAPAAKSSSAAAAPSAAKILAEKNIDASQVAGSGRDGRITKGDALNASAGAAKSAALPSAPIPMGDRPEERVPMSRLRARIAERLLESQANNAILTTFNEVNMAPVIAMRNKYKDQFEKVHGVKLGFMSFFVKAATHALKKFPLLNASVDGNDIVYHGYFDIGIAVSSPRGLVVPILRDVDQMNLADIEKKIAEFGAKARDGKLSIEELTGGTFSISNGGVFGSMLSTPIINPPQSAILGIHATKERAVVENGQIVIRPINYLALSYDHRII
ncbi:MAG TPA: 2-oxoglutarate dehydrogenase complex dihydrolipoyllysine-residue succinyltransferase, partial [Polynucleobacter sp.]|nr:2-oxoglutarate dehydrogenase complex dihydrolipoyllysine-residue succinyltransferase [Polynucleobacter sp.]